MWVYVILFLGVGGVLTADMDETDDTSRKILGSSVVTSVSVILDTGNGNQASYANAVGKPVAKPPLAKLASPIELLNPDRYEFYTFDESGDLVKRLMTMDEIKAIIATSGDDVFNIDNFSDIVPENRVNDIVSNVQNVLREEIEAHKMPDTNQLFDTPDVSDSWSMILPAIFSNSGQEIKADKTATASTPETLVIGATQTEATTKATTTTSTTTISPISIFTNYFSKPPSTESTKTQGTILTKATPSSYAEKSTSRISSSTPKSVTKFSTSRLSSRIPTSTSTPTKISTTTESNILKVQIFPNSNTNSERPYITSSTGGTRPDSEYVRISTPRPQPLLESRISSTTSHKTSPSIFTRISTGTTSRLSFSQASTSSGTTSQTFTPVSTTSKPQFSQTSIPTGTTSKLSISQTSIPSIQLTIPPARTSIPTSSLSIDSTIEPTSSKKQPVIETSSTIYEKLTHLTNIKPTTENENKVTKLTSEILTSNDVSTISQPTEKIYILLRPLSSTTTTTNANSQSFYTTPSNVTSTQTDSKFVDSNDSTKSIFTIISEKPTITLVSATPQTTHNFEKNAIPTKPGEHYVSSTSGSNINQFITTQSSFLHRDGTIVSTSPEEIFSKETSKYDSSSNDTDQTTVTASYKQPYVASTISSTISDLQNTGSILNNKYTSNKVIPNDSMLTKTTESQPDDIETDNTSVGNTQATESISTFTGIQKDLLEKLLLSSTNVYEINSAVTQDLTYPPETTSLSGEISTDYPSSVVEVNPTLIESLGQLLAQAVANVSDVIPNNETLNSQYGTLDPTTTSKAESFDSSTNLYHTTTYFRNPESTKSPLNSEYTVNTMDGTTQATENTYPGTLSNKFNNLDDHHVINISIFKNQNFSKPAKADLSLEVDYDSISSNHTEMQKLSTIVSDAATTTSDLKISTQATTLAGSTQDVENEFTNYFNTNTTGTAAQEEHQTLTTLDRTTNSYPEYSTRVDETIPTEKISDVPTAPVSDSTLTNRPLYSYINKSEETWTLVSTIAPHGKVSTVDRKPTLAPILEPTPTVNLEINPMQGFGLEESTANLDADVYQFVQLCNELAFGFWKSVTTGISSARSVIVSPFAATSLLAMVFLGARGSTSGEMNEILKLDNMVTFNPHLTFKSVTESILTGPDTGVATSAIVRQLYSDRSKEKILNFYKERAKFFYDGHVEEVSFKAVGDTIRRRTNLLIKKHTNGKIQEFLKDGSVRVRPPLAAISGSVMQTDCTKGSITDRDGEIHFVVFPSIKQKRLIPIPAIVYREGFLAGYEPSLDATAVALGDKDKAISFIFVLPGRQGINALGDGLSRLEKRLVESSFQKGAWARLLRTLVPRPELEVQIPRFSHRSIINATAALKHMGLTTLFDINKADLRGLNGVAHDLHLSDMLQFNHFSLCGNTNTGHGHHSEYYPATARRSLRKHRRLDQFEQQKILHDDPLYIINYLSLPLNLRPRQARVPQIPRLRLDRPFLYFVRHNPTGFILHMGRFNPRLLP